jgi:hypothetical protein
MTCRIKAVTASGASSGLTCPPRTIVDSIPGGRAHNPTRLLIQVRAFLID